MADALREPGGGRPGADLKAVVLGMPGPWAEQPGDGDHYSTKVGGLPNFPPTAAELLDASLLGCPVCGALCTLLVQGYAPLTLASSTIPERVLYLFGCLRPACCSTSRGWRVLRIQGRPVELEAAGPTEPITTAAQQERNALEACSNADEWWEGNSWGENRGSSWGDEDSMSLHELSEALAAVGQSVAAKKSVGKGSEQFAVVGNAKVSEPYKSGGSGADDWGMPVLPCFYIVAQEEPQDRKREAEGQPTAAVPGGSLEEGSADVKELWEGETYEHDKALAVDRTFLKFKKRLERAPEQCIRYGFQGLPIWARPQEEKVPACKCGAERCFEMQIMPPTLYFMQEALKEQPSPGCNISGWDWITLAVYTCSKACHIRDEAADSSDGVVVTEEFVVVQQEL